MIRLDAYWFYQIGSALHPLTELSHDTSKSALRLKLYPASGWLSSLLQQNLIPIKTAWPKGNELRAIITRIQKEYDGLTADERKEEIGLYTHFEITSAVQAFETVLAAELSFGDIYVVSKKRGFDTTELAENGVVIFPNELPQKIPESIVDAREAARCIAFELPTAAAFHMHRLHELVLRRFYDKVTNGAERPINRNIGAYIDAMKNAHVKDKKLFSALAILKDFHRNPVLHPDDRLADTEEAMALLGSINTSVTYMLKSIDPPALELTPPPSEISENEIKAIENKT